MPHKQNLIAAVILLLAACSLPPQETKPSRITLPEPKVEYKEKKSEPLHKAAAAPASLDSGADTTARLYIQAMDSSNRGSYDVALKQLEAVIKRSPDFLPAYLTRGKVYQAMQSYKPAIADYKRVLDEAPQMIEARLSLAQAYEEQGHFDPARKEYEYVLKQFPQHPQAQKYLRQIRQGLARQLYVQAGEALAKGQKQEAKDTYLAAIEADPGLSEAHLALAELYFDLGETRRALASLDEFKKLDPPGYTAWGKAGRLYFLMENMDSARECLQRALSLGDPSPETRERMEQVQKLVKNSRNLPEEYLQIASTQAVTRAQLAALLSINLKVPASRRPVPAPVIISDIASHWAREYVLFVAGHNFMQEFPNHNFLPDATVSRAEMAGIISHILTVLHTRNKEDNAETNYQDVPVKHQLYSAIQRVSEAGIMSPTSSQTFGLTQTVSGLESLGIIDRLSNYLAKN